MQQAAARRRRMTIVYGGCLQVVWTRNEQKLCQRHRDRRLRSNLQLLVDEVCTTRLGWLCRTLIHDKHKTRKNKSYTKAVYNPNSTQRPRPDIESMSTTTPNCFYRRRDASRDPNVADGRGAEVNNFVWRASRRCNAASRVAPKADSANRLASHPPPTTTNQLDKSPSPPCEQREIKPSSARRRLTI